MSSPPPLSSFTSYVYLRAGGGGDDSLFLVERGMLQSVRAGWFFKVFGYASTTTESPLPESPRHGLPVYGVPTTAPILREILHLLRFPQLLAKRRNNVPPSLIGIVDLPVWRLSLTYFGFNEWNVIDLDPEDDEDMAEPAAKRAKKEVVSEVRRAYLSNIAMGISRYLKENHPRWDHFARGEIPSMHTQLVAADSNDDIAVTTTLSLPGDDHTTVIAIALWNVVKCGRATEIDMLKASLMKELAPAVDVAVQVQRDVGGDKPPNKPTKIEAWPATEHMARYPAGLPTTRGFYVVLVALSHTPFPSA